MCPPNRFHRTQIGILPLNLRHEPCLSTQWWFWYFSRKHGIVAPAPIRRYCVSGLRCIFPSLVLWLVAFCGRKGDTRATAWLNQNRWGYKTSLHCPFYKFTRHIGRLEFLCYLKNSSSILDSSRQLKNPALLSLPIFNAKQSR